MTSALRKANNACTRGVDRIWQHCRENQNSLDSERHTRIIQAEVDAVVNVFAESNKTLNEENKTLKRENRKQGKELKELREHVERLTATWDIFD